MDLTGAYGARRPLPEEEGDGDRPDEGEEVGRPALGEWAQGEPRDRQHRDDSAEPAGRDEAAPLAARGPPHEGADDLAAVERQTGQQVEEPHEQVGDGDDAEQ